MDAAKKFLRLCSSRNRGAADKHNDILGMQGNLTTPIAKLPVEIMARIFYLLARPTAKGRRDLEEENWDWLELTRVCRSWRDVALGCSTLWSKIRPSFSKKRVEVFLERSGQAALDIELGDWVNNTDVQIDVLELISRHMNQVQNFHISVTDGESAKWDTIQNLFQNPTLRLTNLNLHVVADELVEDDNFVPSLQLEKLASFVSAGVSSFRLESLSLSGVTLPWNSPIFEGLSTLKLANIREDRYRPTISEILAILAASPNLRLLEICNIGPLLSRECYQNVTLHRLERLYISRIEHVALVELFDNLVIPKDVGWILSILNPFTTSKKFPDCLLNRSIIYEALYLIFNDYSLTVNFELTDEDESDNGEVFSDGSDEDDWDKTDMILDFNDEHAPSLQYGFTSFFQSLEPFFRHPFLNTITSLEIVVMYLENGEKIASLTAAVWTKIFAIFPKVRTLTIMFHVEENTKLETQVIEALAGTQNSTILLELEGISLIFARFSTKEGRKAYDTLLSYLIRRRQNGSRLKYLHFQDCYGIGKEETERIKALDVADESYTTSSKEKILFT